MAVKTPAFDLQKHYDAQLGRLWRRCPFVLRITEWKDVPVPVLVVKERQSLNGSNPHPQPPLTQEAGRLRATSLNAVTWLERRNDVVCPFCARSSGASAMSTASP
jgi:hypothetical protein